MVSLATEWQARFRSKAISVTAGWHEHEPSVLSTGSLALDIALGIGGFPRGKIVELYGAESTGKTTLALAAIAQCEKRSGRAAMLESEHKLTKAWVRKAGIDLSRTLLLNCADAVECLRALCELLHSGEFDLIVLDSLAGLIWNSEISSGDASGEAERLLERSLALIASEAHRTNTSLLILNQIRTDYKKVFGDPTVTVGGRVLRHSCAIRVELTNHLPLKRGNEVIGSLTKATVKKNSLGSCFHTALLPYTYAHGLDHLYELVQLAKQHSVFDSQTVYFEFDGELLGKTELDTYDYLLAHPSLGDAIRTNLDFKLSNLDLEERQGR